MSGTKSSSPTPADGCILTAWTASTTAAVRCDAEASTRERWLWLNFDDLEIESIAFPLLPATGYVPAAGKLVNNRISWRGDSGLMDGSEEGLDLSKGMYDAGDSIKFGFPMAFTATMLSWAILEYGDQMNAVKQLREAQDSLKWFVNSGMINERGTINDGLTDDCKNNNRVSGTRSKSHLSSFQTRM